MILILSDPHPPTPSIAGFELRKLSGVGKMKTWTCACFKIFLVQSPGFFHLEAGWVGAGVGGSPSWCQQHPSRCESPWSFCSLDCKTRTSGCVGYLCGGHPSHLRSKSPSLTSLLSLTSRTDPHFFLWIPFASFTNLHLPQYFVIVLYAAHRTPGLFSFCVSST